MTESMRKLHELFDTDGQKPIVLRSNVFERRYNLIDWINLSNVYKYDMDSLEPLMKEVSHRSAFLEPLLEERVKDFIGDKQEGLVIGSIVVTAAEYVAINKYLQGEDVRCSTGICENITYGFGKLDDHGYWQYPLPSAFLKTLRE